jgi:lysophospholipase L1-like esterase
MADQTQRLEVATVKAEVGGNIIYRFGNDALAAAPIPTDSGPIQNMKQVISAIQAEGEDQIDEALDNARSTINKTDPTRYKTLCDVLRKAHTGGAITIACYGDSLTYGQDTSATGVDTQINGATQKRSTAPYPEKLAESLGLLAFAVPPVVINYGFPGDNSARGLTRWANTPSADLSILMYGTNDANNYGNLGVVDIPSFRSNMDAMIVRELEKGAAVILMGAPPIYGATDANIRPYAREMQSLAAKYSIPFIDAVEQLSSVTNIWTDNVHLTSIAYRELGWNLASLFVRRDGAMKKVSEGSLILATQGVGIGGAPFIWTVGTENRTVIQLNAGQTLAIGIYCESRLQPIVHSVNGTSKVTTLTAYYSAGILGAARLDHAPANGTEQMLFATPMNRGFRVLYLRNDGADVTYVKGIEFAAVSSPALGGRNSKKVPALCGAHIPMRNAVVAGANGWLALISYENRITLLGGMIFRVRIPSTTGSPGVAIVSVRSSSAFPSANCLMAIRSGVNLIFRQYISGSSITDVTVTGFFTSGVEWVGELEIELSAGVARLYANGVLVATMNGSVVSSGWGGLVCTGAVQTPSCDSAFIYGYDKELV